MKRTIAILLIICLMLMPVMGYASGPVPVEADHTWGGDERAAMALPEKPAYIIIWDFIGNFRWIL